MSPEAKEIWLQVIDLAKILGPVAVTAAVALFKDYFSSSASIGRHEKTLEFQARKMAWQRSIDESKRAIEASREWSQGIGSTVGHLSASDVDEEYARMLMDGIFPQLLSGFNITLYNVEKLFRDEIELQCLTEVETARLKEYEKAIRGLKLYKERMTMINAHYLLLEANSYLDYCRSKQIEAERDKLLKPYLK